MVMVRGAFGKSIAPGYRKVFFETYKQRPVEGRKLVNSKTSKRAYEEEFPIAGLGPLLVKVEGQSVSYDDATEGEAKRYTWTTYGRGFRITMEMMEDDLYGVMGNKMSKALGRSARNNEEIIMHLPYNNAFNTAVNGFVAGEALCGTHTSIKGVVQANAPTVPVDFGLLAFQAAIEHFDNMLDETGLPMMIMPKILVHGVGDQWIVKQILKSSSLPGTNQNDVNPVAGVGITPHMSHNFIIDPDAWFILGDEHDVNYYERRPLSFSNTDDFDSGDAKFKAHRRNGSGFGDWRGIYGTPGA